LCDIFNRKGNFREGERNGKKWRYLTIENHVHYKHCVDSDIKVRISKALLRYQKITFWMEIRSKFYQFCFGHRDQVLNLGDLKMIWLGAVILFAFNTTSEIRLFPLEKAYYKHCVDSDIKVRISKALLRYQKITFWMEIRCSLTLVLLPRLSPIGKIVHLIGDNFKPFFFKIGKLSLGETVEFRLIQGIINYVQINTYWSCIVRIGIFTNVPSNILLLASKRCFLTSQGLVGVGMNCRTL
jgi:ribosomal protein S13